MKHQSYTGRASVSTFESVTLAVLVTLLIAAAVILTVAHTAGAIGWPLTIAIGGIIAIAALGHKEQQR